MYTILNPILFQPCGHMQVSVQRRETDRQLEARQRSFAYQQRMEDAEPWVSMRSCGEASAESNGLWNQVMAPSGRDLDMSLSRQQYLDTLVLGVHPTLGSKPCAMYPETRSLNPLRCLSEESYRGFRTEDGGSNACITRRV